MSDDIRKFVDAIKNPTPEEAEKFKKMVVPLDKYFPQVAVAFRMETTRIAKAAARISEALESVNQTKEKVLSLIDRGESIDQFFDLPPINGIELLAILAEMDERTQEQARQILSSRNTKAVKTRHARTEPIKEWFQAEYLKKRTMELASSAKEKPRIKIARELIKIRLEKYPREKKYEEVTVSGWLKETE